MNRTFWMFLSLLLICGPLDDALLSSSAAANPAKAPGSAPFEEEDHKYTSASRPLKRSRGECGQVLKIPSEPRYLADRPKQRPSDLPILSRLPYPPRVNGFGGALRC